MSSQNNQAQPDNMADDPLSNQDNHDQISLPEEMPKDSHLEDFQDDNAPVVDSAQIDAQKDDDIAAQEEDQSQLDEVGDNDAPSQDNEESKNEVDGALLSDDQDDLLGSAIDPEEALEEEGAEDMLVEVEEELEAVVIAQSELKPISDKFFYKEMARIKEKSKTTGIGTLPPKKSASAYIIFQKEKRPEILAKNPKAKVTEVVKEIARCWSLLSKDDRMVYKVQAKRDKERYERELKTLEDQSSTIKKPKKCLSAYMIFVQETRPKIVKANPDMGALMVMKEVGRAWQAMVETDRKYFKDKADNDKHRYLAESRRFYDEVSRIGEQNNQEKKAALQNSKAKVQIKSRQDQETSKCSDDEENNDVLAGKKRPANTKATKLLNRSSSFSKRGANQVMSIGLAPEEGGFASPQDIAAQKRMRAESRFTFKPDEQSDEQVLSEKDDDFENEDEDDSDDGLYEELFGEDGPPETAIQFFAKEFRLSIRKDFYELKNSLQNKAIKKRWDELTSKQQQPFMTLARTEAEKREDLTKKDSGSAARRNAKCSLKIKKSIPVSTVACLNRTSQRIAKEALSLPKDFKDELKASLERQKNANRHQPNDNQLDNQQGFEDGNQNKGGLELSEMGAPAGSGLFDMDSIGLAKNMWSGTSMNRNQSGGMQNGGSNIQAQNQLNAQLQTALQNGYLNLLGNSLNLQQNGPNQLSLAQQQQLLLGQQNQNESDYFGLQNTTGSSTGLSNDFLQQQLLQQQLGGLNQQQYTNNLMSILLAQQNMQGNNLLLNQQALQQNLQHPTTNQQSLFNQQNLFNLLQQQKLAQSLGGSGGGNQFGGGGFDWLGGGGGSNQMNNFYGGMHKTQETPQFAGMIHDSLIGGDELAFQSLPTAATQPIANIFYPTSTAALEEPINFSHLLNSGINPAQATPVTNAALGNMQNSMFLQDFQLPASASSPFQNLNDVGANTKPMFGQDNKTQQNGANQLNHSPQISPQIGPLAHNNDHSQNADQPQNLLMWQQNPLSSRNSVQKIGSSNNMLGNVLGQSNKNFMQQQSTPTSVTFMNPLKDQLAMNNSSAQSYLGNQSTPNLNLAVNTPHTDQFNNSTSVTPFLKPTARQSECNQQGALQSPFMKALQHPGANGGGGNIPSTHSYASMLGLPGVANNNGNTNNVGISPILGAQSHNANMSLQHQQQLSNALQGNNTGNGGAGSAASMTPLQNQTFGNQATGQNSSFLAQSLNASRDT